MFSIAYPKAVFTMLSVVLVVAACGGGSDINPGVNTAAPPVTTPPLDDLAGNDFPIRERIVNA